MLTGDDLKFGDVKGTIIDTLGSHFVPNDVRRHHLISISYTSLSPFHRLLTRNRSGIRYFLAKHRVVRRDVTPTSQRCSGNRYAGLPPRAPPKNWRSASRMSQAITEAGAIWIVTSSQAANTGPTLASASAASLRYLR